MRITESRILLPMLDNNGKSLAMVADAMRADLLKAFGGFSESTIRGMWRDESTGNVFKDESIAFDIAADWSAPAYEGADMSKAERLKELAQWYCRAANQVCLYLRDGKGFVSYVAPLAARAANKAERDAA